MWILPGRVEVWDEKIGNHHDKCKNTRGGSGDKVLYVDGKVRQVEKLVIY